ncbi:MAG TPA: DUF4230 domain-containing protein [Actinomycetes bacterium]|nr:DUF4230 domain-containing protein [Actinomycetes bacterium]
MSRRRDTQQLPSHEQPPQSWPRVPLPRDGRRARWPLVVLAVVAVVALAFALTGMRSLLRNPFGARTVDRSQPVLLKAIEDLHVYKAASGNYQVIIDLEKDAPLVPSAVKGERILFVAGGNVDAEVDFGRLGKDAIRVSPDRRSVTVTLPPPTLGKPHVDPARSRVVSHQRGLLDRLGDAFGNDPGDERQLYLLAERKLAEAAGESGLAERAEGNTRAMLQGMLRSLGYTNVTVIFTEPPSVPR